jgi:hypothetical protein
VNAAKPLSIESEVAYVGDLGPLWLGDGAFVGSLGVQP